MADYPLLQVLYIPTMAQIQDYADRVQTLPIYAYLESGFAKSVICNLTSRETLESPQVLSRRHH
jgi:hypothetical protein